MSWFERRGGTYVVRHAIRWQQPEIQVPKGFRFNVSVPKGLRWLIDPHDERLLRAACFHDYAIHWLKWSRPLSAALWNEVLRDAGYFSLIWRAILFVTLALWKFK